MTVQRFQNLIASYGSLSKIPQIWASKTIIFIATLVLCLAGLWLWGAYDLKESISRERIQSELLRVNLLASDNLERLQLTLSRPDGGDVTSLLLENLGGFPFITEIRKGDQLLWPRASFTESIVTKERWRLNQLVLLGRLELNNSNVVISPPYMDHEGDARVIGALRTQKGKGNAPIYISISVLRLLEFSEKQLRTEPIFKVRRILEIPEGAESETHRNTLISKGNLFKISIAGSLLGVDLQVLGDTQPTSIQEPDLFLVPAALAITLVALLLCLKLYFEIKTRQDAEERVRSQEIKAQKNASLATLGEISTLVSHEINQPLAAIEVYASTCSHKLMKRGFEAEQKEERHSLLQAQNNIKKEVARIKKIIDSIRGLAKRKSSEMRRLSIAETIEAIRPLIAIQAKSIGSVIEVSVDKKADVVFDPSALEQVLLNVIRNGLESMIKTDGAKVLRIQADALDAKLVRLQVIDRGTGIPPAFQDKVFSPFFSTKESGTGLGLNYCYSLLEKFGGRIWFEASPTGGTVFNIDLPRAQDS